MKNIPPASLLLPIGWYEWVALPDLQLPLVKAKVDTGAKTSALHASSIREYWHNTEKWVQFEVHPLQRDTHFTVTNCAQVIDERVITNSGGQRELRYVIKTTIKFAETLWEIELTLTQRHDMTFRMLLGREALHQRVIIDPAHVCLQGKFTKNAVRRAYGLPRLSRKV
jgi:hypothetical protein